MRRKVQSQQVESGKVLDVDAAMQGSLIFRDPVNLRINGNFDGSLDTKGCLTVGENAMVKADIKGEDITIAGKVNGNITATKVLRIVPPAHVLGDITAPVVSVDEGAILEGHCQMVNIAQASSGKRSMLTADELARYLEVETSMIAEWANAGKLPGVREKNEWKFDRIQVDEWVANGKVK